MSSFAVFVVVILSENKMVPFSHSKENREKQIDFWYTNFKSISLRKGSLSLIAKATLLSPHSVTKSVFSAIYNVQETVFVLVLLINRGHQGS